jgi:putative chitinase
MTRDQYNKIVKRRNNATDDIIYKNIVELFITDRFDTIEKKAHFMSQICHESNNITKFIENLNYSSEGLLKNFSKYFTKSTANIYARQPERIANIVYANRMGNGDVKSGDGWKYRGASPIQLTGKEQFRECGKYLGIDLVNNPEFAQDIECGISICGWFWKKKSLNKIIDGLGKDNNISIINYNVEKITRIINGGINGLNERIILYKLCKKILS